MAAWDRWCSNDDDSIWLMVCGKSGLSKEMCVVNPDSVMFVGYDQRQYYVNAYNQQQHF